MYKENLVNSAYSELYHTNTSGAGYDDLNRLKYFQRGTLNSGKDQITGTVSRSQDYNLDALGNWSSLSDDGGSAVNRTHNRQNQLTAIGSTNLAYDNNGNTIFDENGKTLIYDAWNHLVAYKNGSTVLTSYNYDALSRRITESPGTTNDLYYTASWQLIEERQGGVTMVQNVWSAAYIAGLVLRERDADNDSGTGDNGMTGSGLDERLYVQQDANWNTTALSDTSGRVLQRLVYDPYGKAYVFSASWAATTDAFAFANLHQGGRQDAVTGFVNFRKRDDNVTTGRWQQMASLRSADRTNRYTFISARPQAAGVQIEKLIRAIWFQSLSAYTRNYFPRYPGDGYRGNDNNGGTSFGSAHTLPNSGGVVINNSNSTIWVTTTEVGWVPLPPGGNYGGYGQDADGVSLPGNPAKTLKITDAQSATVNKDGTVSVTNNFPWFDFITGIAAWFRQGGRWIDSRVFGHGLPPTTQP
jgi:YD repeat-containing protein